MKNSKNDRLIGIAEVIFFLGVVITGVGVYLVINLGYTCIFVGIVLIYIGYTKAPSNE